MNQLSVKCHAKINLGLRVYDKRPDGYHNIETTFKIIGLHDEIILTEKKGGEVSLLSAAKNIPLDDNNICIKAVKLLQRETGAFRGLEISLTKHIPVGAGLGGGSSNGAGTLYGCNRLFNLGLKDEKLMAMAAELGSDVSFFMGYLLGSGNTATGKGRGEILDYFDWSLNEKILIVYPNIEISTGWAYQNFKKHPKPPEEGLLNLNLTNNEKNIMFSAIQNRPMFFDNVFEPLVFSEYEEIRQLHKYLQSFKPILTHMSGSGSTIFAIFPQDTTLMEELIFLKRYYVAVTRFE